jgi:hypothetical protein
MIPIQEIEEITQKVRDIIDKPQHAKELWNIAFIYNIKQISPREV